MTSLGDAIGLMCEWWDELMERVQSESVAVVNPSSVGRGFLRLVVVDMALRMVGWAYLADVELPEAHVPAWARANGGRDILRDALRESGLRRHDLARELEVSPTTVDNWLGGRNFPSWFYLPVTGASSGTRERGRMLISSKRGCGGSWRWRVCPKGVAAVVGWDAVAADVEAAFGFARLMQQMDALSSVFEWAVEAAKSLGSDMSKKSDMVGGYVALMLVRMGASAPFAGRLLWPLAGMPETRDWADDVRAVASSMELQLRHIAGSQSGTRTAAGLAQDYFDVVVGAQRGGSRCQRSNQDGAGR